MSIIVSLEQIGDELVIAVEDSGIGIAIEHLDTIFVRFSGEEERLRGLGLGLFISKCIVQGHGGRIWAESKPGGGTTVRFTLPLDAPA